MNTCPAPGCVLRGGHDGDHLARKVDGGFAPFLMVPPYVGAGEEDAWPHVTINPQPVKPPTPWWALAVAAFLGGMVLVIVVGALAWVAQSIWLAVFSR